MITFYEAAGNCLVRRDSAEVSDATIWIDLLNPTAEEEDVVEKALGLDVPTRAEMREIEVSNRFYTEGGAHFMTALLMQAVEGESPIVSNVTFILVGKRLVTVRYAEPKAFPIFAERACKGDPQCLSGPDVLIGLLETIVQRQADHIERIQDEVETIAPQIFGQKSAGGVRGRRLDVLLRTVGRAGDLTSRAQESAVSVNRTLYYFADAARARGDGNGLIARVDSAARDVTSLVEHLRSLSGRTAFLLDATLGFDLQRAEPDHQAVLGDGGDADAADARRIGLRHELRENARDTLDVRLSHGAGPDVRIRAGAVHLLPPQGLALEGRLDRQREYG